MKMIRALLAIVSGVMLFAACSTPNTAALRVGMSKDEAIKVMGEPNSVSAQMGYEYLNYILSETTSGGGYWSRPYYIRLAEGKVQAFGYSEQINRLLPLAGATANAAAKSTALRVGMTKAEAIAVMGTPGSVSAQGSYEYLNYTSSDVSPSGMSVMTRPYYVRLTDGRVDAFGFTDQISRGLAPIGSTTTHISAPTGGTVTVLSVQPTTLIAGQSTEVTVRVKYAATTGEKFRLSILCNTLGTSRFQQVGEQVVEGKSGEATVKATVVPVDWGEGTQVRFLAHLFPYPSSPHEAMRPIAYGIPFAVPLTK